MYALFLTHRAKPGCRDALEAVWRRHMLPAIYANADHLTYTYSFGTGPDEVAAFQVYRSREAADAFLQSPPYRGYLEESRPLLAREPEVTVLEPRWVKGFGRTPDRSGAGHPGPLERKETAMTDKQAGHAQVPPMVARGMRGAGHEALAPLIGEWDVTLSIFAAGGTPKQPVVVQLDGRREWIGGDRFVRETLEGDGYSGDGPRYWREGTLGWSTVDERYEFVTQDAVNANMMIYLGADRSRPGFPISMSGVFTDQGILGEEMVGEPIGQRTVVTVQDDDQHRVDILFTPPGGEERLVDRKDFVRRR